MKKTITIHLNQVIFNIEEDAFDKLKNYLDSIEKHYQKTDDTKEIVSDIESGAADHFAKKMGKSKNIITVADVEELITSMGTVEDISAQDNETESNFKQETENYSTKKLFRDTNTKVIAGVAAGLGTYLNIDSTIIRLIFVITLFLPRFNGFGFLLYIILWFIVPEAKTTVDKISMRGEPITLSNLAATINSKIDSSSHQGFRKVLDQIVEFISETSKTIFIIFGKIFWLISAIFGLLLVIAAALGVAGLVSVLVGLLTNQTIIYGNLSLANIFPTNLYFFGLLAISTLVFIPLIFILLSGVSLMRRRSAFRLGLSIFLFFTWIIAFAATASLALNLTPPYQGQINEFIERIQHRNTIFVPSETENNQSIEILNLKDFQKIQSNGAWNLKIKKSPDFEVKVLASKNQFDLSQIRVNNDTLMINNSGKINYHYPLATVEIGLPQLDSLIQNGYVKSEITGINQKEFKIDLSGASSSKISGSAEKLNIITSGAANIDTTDLIADNVVVNSSGASRATVLSETVLTATASGASKIFYVGNPKINQNTSGVAQIIQK